MLFRSVPFAVFLRPIVVGTPGHKGGRVTYQRVRNDVLRALKQDHAAYCSTLFDFYGLGNDFPSLGQTMHDPASVKVDHLEKAILRDIVQRIPEFRPDARFIPYIQLHEFEGLLFSDPTVLAAAMFREDLAPKLHAIRNGFASPEEINDSPQTAPSKRIIGLNQAYNKVISGSLAAEQMGIDVIKESCPRFRAWFERLAALGVALVR